MSRLPVRVIVAAVLLLRAGAAAADGAFPDSMSMFLPSDRPREIVLATNFGLVTSEDDGATWQLVCEQAVSPAAKVSAYQMSAPPDDTLYAISPGGLAYSTDRGCSWTFASGAVGGANVLDAFADPSDPASLFAITSTTDDAGAAVEAVYQSTDHGHSFTAPPLYTASASQSLTGVEIARSAPHTLYLTMFSYPPLTPLVARSTAGSSFQLMDESAAFSSQPFLAAVDPVDARILYLRLRGQGDALGISRDGGTTFSLVLPLAGRMSALLRRASGVILVGSGNGPSLRSVDGGNTFAPWPNAPHVRALGERGNVLYVAGDDARDGFAMARSSDEGAHWTPILHFRDIVGPLACGDLPSVCAAPWATVVALSTPASTDMAAGHHVPGPPPPHAGCGCSVGARAQSPSPLLLCILCLGFLVRLIRVRSRS